MLSNLWAELRHAARALLRAPGFTLTSVVTLGLGLGAATAMFTVVDGVLLRPLPYPNADRVVSLWTRYLPESGYDFPQFSFSGPELVEYRAQSRSFEDIAAYLRTGALVEGAGGESVRVGQVMGAPNLFATLGVEPELGRAFLPEEGEPGADCVVMLSHGLWLDAFGGNPGAVGGGTRIGGQSCTVVGVMPAGFAFPDADVRVWRNLVLDPASPGWGRLNHSYSAVGRLADGVTLAAAEAETETLMAAWASDYPDHHKGHFVFLRPLLEDVVGNVRADLTMLLAAVGVVLAVICANLASLLLARGEGRRREVGVRLALGGGRARLVMGQLAESAVLAAAGGALGLMLAVFFLDGLLALYPGTLPRAAAVAIDWRAYLFAALATCGSALLFGLVPAWRSTSTQPGAVLRSQGRGAAAGAGRTRLMRAFVVAEVALSVTLVAGAGLLLRSYENLRSVDLGFDADGVYTVSQALPAVYQDNAGIRAFFSGLLEQLAALPGVSSVGAISNLPLQGGAGARDDFIVEGRPEPAPGEQQPNAGYVLATPGYFETLRIPVLAGRALAAGDVRDAPWVAVINEEAAQRFWPNEDPIGRRLRYRGPRDLEWITVVGVVGDTRVNGARAEPEPQIFVPHAQMPRDAYPGRFMAIVVRSSGDAAQIAPAVNAAVRAADRSLPLIGGRPLADMVGDSVGQPRFVSVLVTFFGVVAFLLGALGIHGVLSYVVAQRVGEIGLRMALGARPMSVLRLVVGQGMRLTLLGVVLGLGGALAAAQLFRGLLFGVQPLDAPSLGLAVAVLGVAALAACLGPARRAARIDPMEALRAE